MCGKANGIGFMSLPVAFLCMLMLVGCRKERLNDYDIPSTYQFEPMSYAGQIDRLKMLVEMSQYMKSANVPGISVDPQVLRNMFENANAPFSFTSERQLKDKCFLSDQALFESYFDSMGVGSLSAQVGSDGVAGVVFSSDSSKSYLFDAKGWEYTQLIEKGLMGAVFYYQATGVYLSESKIGEDVVDNETVVPGEGTAMEHHWDEAFGYWGVPVDFPSNTAGLLFYGKYTHDRNPLLGSSKRLMQAFTTGRAAISNDDHATKWAQIAIIQEEWEKVMAATAIHYINEGLTNLADDALRNHALTEAVAFVRSLKYNPNRKITDSQISAFESAIGANLYRVTTQGLDGARSILSQVYGFDSIKEVL
jgi:hypothetical protein